MNDGEDLCCMFTEYVEGEDLYTQAIKRCPKEFTENKSIFYANRAACFQKLVGIRSFAYQQPECLQL